MSKLHDSTWGAAAAILGSVTFLGVGTSWAKHALFPLIGAQGTTVLRIGFAALMLLVLWRPWRWPLTRRDAGRVAMYGAALGAMNLCFYLALRTIPFGVAVAIEFAGPLAVALWSSRRPLDFIWVTLAVLGLGLLLPVRNGVGALDPVGVLFALTAAVFWATYIVFGKRVGHLPTRHTVPLGLTVAALVVAPIGIGHAGGALLAPDVLAVGAGVAVLSSAIPISLEMMALKRLPPQAFGVMISVEPAVSALLALVLLDESLSLIQWSAIGMIVMASMGSAVSAQRGAAHP